MKALLAFVGGGQMAGSMIGGLLAAGHPPSGIRVAEPDATRAQSLRSEFGVDVAASASGITSGADALVLAVKPQAIREAVSGLHCGKDVTVVSIAAGIRIDTLRACLGPDPAIVRCMPNTPALFRSGVTGLHAPPGTPAAARDLAEEILRSVGEVCWIDDEALLDAVTALSGSGPAYYFQLTEILRDAGVSLGLDATTAGKLATGTFIGAARMAAESGRDVAELRAGVTSKGGTTEAALKHLRDNGLSELFTDALRAAARRARELGDSLA